MADPVAFENMTKVVKKNSEIFRAAANSTGDWEAHQVRIKSATDSFTESLEKQKLSWRDLRKSSDIAKAAYRDQLRMQQMVVRQLPVQSAHGKSTFDMLIPTDVHKDLDTLGNKIGWIREQTRSAATQMINWGKNTQWAGRQLMVGFTIPLVAFGAAAGVLAYNVDKELTRIEKVYDTTADATNTTLQGQMAVEKELARVREQGTQTAINAAREYGAVGRETLEIQAELAATGLKGAELQTATREVMRISTLGEMDRQDALNATITLQSVFQQSNKELTESFNYMNAVENATSLQLKDFAAAIPIAAAPVKAFGGDIFELGTLLTAMRENGIQATEGANALKAAMQRLGRPSKQIQQEFSAITGKSIVELVDSSEGLTEIFTKLNEVTKDLEDSEKRDVFAGLFGSYQVTRMMALVDGMGKLAEGTGQVSDAARIATQDSKKWADAADVEMERLMSSVSGRFKAAVEEAKMELQSFGAPFLKVATVAIKAITSIIKAINGLPEPIKIMGAVPLVFLAIVGPLIMLAGLFGNFAGNFLKWGVALSGFLTKFELLNKESAVAIKANELAKRGFVSETTAIQHMTVALDKLNMSLMKTSELQGLIPAGSTAAYASGAMKVDPNTGSLIYANAIGPDQKKTRSQMLEEERASANTKRNWGSIASSAAMAAGAVAIMAQGSGESSQKFGELLLTAALLAPMLGPVFRGLKAAGGHVLTWAKGFNQTGKHAAKTAGFAAKAGRATSAIGTGLRMALHPAGLVALAVAGIGYGLWKWNEHLKEVAKRERDAANALHSTNNLLNKQLDIRIQKQKTLNTLVATDIRRNGEIMPTGELADKLVETDEGKDLVESFKNADDIERERIAMEKYAQVLQAVGGNSQKARQYLSALFYASDMGLAESEELSQSIQQRLGDTIDNADWVEIWTSQFTQVFDDSTDAAATHGKAMGENFTHALASATQGAERNAVFDNIVGSMDAGWESLWNNMHQNAKDALALIGVDTTNELRELMADAQRLSEGDIGTDDIISKWGADAMYAIGEARTYAGTAIDAARISEEEIVKVLKEQLNITGDITTMDELRNTVAWRLQTVTKKNYKDLLRSMETADRFRRSTLGLLGIEVGVNKERRLSNLNIIRANMGLHATTKLSDGVKKQWHDTNGELVKGKGGVDGINRALARTQHLMGLISNEDITNLAKEAMTSLQQRMADDASADFDRQQTAALDALERSGQARLDALEDRQEAATNAMERRHEAAANAMERRHEALQNALENRQEARRKRIESGFDKRIEAIDKAIEAEQRADDIRQRIFEAEMTRLDRLNEMQNRDIDFNVALNTGDLDEAAKIRNDAQNAASQWSLEDAAAKGAGRTERRISNLEDTQESIEKAKDKALENLDKIEEAEKRSLDRRLEAQKRMLDRSQEAQKRALENRLEAERESLENSIEANRAAEEAKWQSRRDYLDKSLDYFTRYIAKDAKDLQKHIKLWRSEHGELTDDTRDKFNWSTDRINNYLRGSIKDSRRAIVNENEWEADGYKIARQMIKGAFGLSPEQFRKWMVTGNYPKGGSPYKGSGGGSTNAAGGPDGDPTTPNRHTGGWINNSPGSRKGVARNTKGTHPSEVMLRAKRGEFMVNERAAAKHGPLLEAINSGKADKKQTMHPKGGVMGGIGSGMNAALATGFAGIMLGAMRQAVSSSIKSAVNFGAQKAWQNELKAMSGSFGSPGAGTFAGTSLDAAQVGNAVTIANVGKQVGASARDIQIAFMTAMVESGLRNLDYGDRDSVGLFQQRNSWGTFEARTTPEISARMFFTGGSASDGWSEPGLLDIENRNSMSMGQAAQAVQVSAYPDRYQAWAAMAQALFSSLRSVGGASGGYVPGSGGKHRPIKYAVSSGLHGAETGYNALDLAGPSGAPIRAVADGTVTASYDIPGYEPRASHGGNGYKSYGRVIRLRTNGGPEVLYAHLSKRSVAAGQKVKGGATLGYSGNTGYSTGPHLHFGSSDGNPGQFTGLKKGAARIKVDEGLFNLHKNEAVLTEDLNAKFQQGVENFAAGPSNEYNVNVYVMEPGASADEIANRAVTKMRREDARRATSRRIK